MIGNQRGPIKATKQMVVKKENNAPPGQNVDLCIDSRKPKRPLGSESYNDPDEVDLERDEVYGQEAERVETAQTKQDSEDPIKFE